MTLITEIRKNVSESTPLMAVVGATDYAVERVRAAANASTLQAEFEKRVQALEQVPARVEERMKKLDAKAVQQVPALAVARAKKLDAKAVQQVPALAVARALEAAGRMEQSYEKFAERGKDLIDRVARQQSTQDLFKQGRVTISRTRAAVTTARKAVDDTAAAALSAVSLGRREAAGAVEDVAGSVAATEKVVQERTKATRVAAKRAVGTARKRAVGTRAATRGVVTSARRTAEQAVAAAGDAAAAVGDDSKATPAE